MTRFAAPIVAVTAVTLFIPVLNHLAAAQTAPSAKAPPNTPFNYNWPDGPGKDVVKKACLSCHNASVIVVRPGRTEDGWADEVSKMIGRGAILSDDDADLVIEYLSTHFGPDSKSKPPVPSGSEDKPPSSGKTSASTHGNNEDSGGQADSSAPLNVNKASAEQLQLALGLSKAEADSILEHRQRYGNFKSWREVAAVHGVPVEKIEQNQKRIVF